NLSSWRAVSASSAIGPALVRGCPQKWQKLSSVEDTAPHTTHCAERLASAPDAPSAPGGGFDSTKSARKIAASKTQIPCPMTVTKARPNNQGKISIGLSMKKRLENRRNSKPVLQTMCLQSNSVSRQFLVRPNARYNHFSTHKRALSKRRANTLESITFQAMQWNYTGGELSMA